MAPIELHSSAFEDGKRIPDEYGYTAANVNPPLTIEEVPPEAESLALIVDDPDAVEPAGTIWDHWVVWNIPPDATSIPEEWDASDAVEGRNDYGEMGYGGPNPPDREHTYRFRLVALSGTVDLASGATVSDLEEKLEGLVIDQTTLEGTYSPTQG
ncbi:MAG: YbhB/YbcL family Raf kinase inhibitor-like protein [Halanaeroarchaeum sp.]